jgi:hypothetical protein
MLVVGAGFYPWSERPAPRLLSLSLAMFYSAALSLILRQQL